jgi:O-antigen/teichoic acid export membrane protein
LKNIKNLFSNFKNEIFLVNSVKFFLITAISKFFSFIVYPILSRHFSTSDFGYFDIFVTFTTLASTIGLLGLDSMLYRYLFDDTLIHKKDHLVSNTIFTQIMWFIFLVLIFFLFFLSGIINIDKSNIKINDIIFFILAIFGMMLYSTTELILKISPSLMKYSFLVISNSTIFLISTYVFVEILDFSISQYIKLYSLLYFILSIIGLYFIRSYINYNYFKLINISYLYYALPLCMMTLFPLFQSFFFRTIIFQNLTSQNSGLFAASSKLTILYSLPAFAVLNSTMPLLLKSYKENNFNVTANRTAYFTLISMSFITILISLFSVELCVFSFGENYGKSGFVLSCLCLGLFLQSVTGLLSIAYLIKNLTILRMFSNIAFTVLSIYVPYLLIKPFGINGLMIGLIIVNALQLLADLFISKRIFQINWRLKGIFFFIFFTIFLVIIFQILFFKVFLIKLLITFFIIIIYTIFYKKLLYNRDTSHYLVEKC